MSAQPLVSIVVNNFNYGQYLRDAINSGLNQTYSRIEIIVVDDGSTDDSRTIIEEYGEKIVPICKANGGQASAFNAGFLSSQGEIIIFLDADDHLKPDLAEKVVAAYCSEPDIAKIHYRLEIVDAFGRSTGSVQPPWDQPLPSGDLRQELLTFPDDLTWQPTSGNAFAAWVLWKIFPLPEALYPLTGADMYIVNLAPLFGKVLSIQEIGGCYRVHASNHHYTNTWYPELSRKIILRTINIHRSIKTFADSLCLTGFSVEPAEVLSVTFLAHRMASLKVDPGSHPISGDKLSSLFFHGIRASAGRFDVSWIARSFYFFWFFAVLLAPRRAVPWLADKFFYPETRGELNRLFLLTKRLTGRSQSLRMG